MRLKLNRTLRAALIAAITAVGFTLSQAQAADETVLTTTFSLSGTGSDQWTLTGTPGTGYNLTTTKGALIKLSGSSALGNKTSGGVTTSQLNPDTNVQNVSGWQLTFSVTNNSTEAVTIDSMTVNSFLFNSGGAYQSAATTRFFMLTMGGGDQTVAEEVKIIGSSNNHPESGVIKFDFNSAVTLAQNESKTFTVKFDKSTQTDGCFVGLTSVVLNHHLVATVSNWRGTAGDNSWTNPTAWDTPFADGNEVVFGTGDYHKTVVLSEAVETAKVTVQDDYTIDIQEAGSMSVGTDGIVISAGKTLTLKNGNTTALVLGTITGEGSLALASGAFSMSSYGATGKLVVNGGTLDMGSASYTLDDLEISNGGEVSTSRHDGKGCVTGDIHILSDGTFRVVGGHDAFGYNGNQTDNIYLKGVDAQHLATLSLEQNNTTNSVTMQTNLHLGGYASIVSKEGTKGFNTHGCSISAEGEQNTIALMDLRRDVTIDVAANGTLAIAKVTKNNDGTKIITKTGEGTLSFTGDSLMNGLNVNEGIVAFTAGTSAVDALTIAAGGTLQIAGGTTSVSGNSNVISHTINLQAGTLTLTGAYDISGIESTDAPTYVGDGGQSIAEGNGFKHTEGKVRVVNITEGGNLSAATATFTYGTEQRTGLDEDGYFTLAGSTDYSVLYVNNNNGVSYNAAWDVAQAQSTNITSVAMAADTTALTADKEGASFALSLAGTATVNATKDATVTALTGTGKLIVDGSKTVAVQSISGYSGAYEVKAGATIEFISANMAALGNLTVAGDGTVRLVSTTRSESGNALGTLSATNLELADNSSTTGRYYYSGSSSIAGVDNLKFAGGQLWLTSDMTYEGKVTFGTTTYTETNDFSGAAIRVNASGTFTGVVDVQGTAKLVWGESNKTLAFNNTVTGSGNIDLIGWNGKTGTFTIGGDASGYEGAMTTNDKITLNVTNGAALTINSGSDIKGAVTLGTGSSLTVTGDGDSSISGIISGDGGIVKDGYGTLTLKGANTYTGTTEVKAGKLVVEGSIASQNVILGEDASIENKGSGAITLSDVNEQLAQVENIGSGTLELKNESGTLSVVDLTIAAGSTISFHDKADTPAEGTITVTETLTAGGGTLLANLVLEGGAMLDLGGAGENALTLGSNLAFVNGGLVTLDDATLAQLDALVMGTDSNYLELVKAAEGTTLTYGGAYNDLWFGQLFDRPDTLVGDFKVVATGTSFGLTKVSNIPEPTTGTLSLLALAALAARRRKHN